VFWHVAGQVWQQVLQQVQQHGQQQQFGQYSCSFARTVPPRPAPWAVSKVSTTSASRSSLSFFIVRSSRVWMTPPALARRPGEIGHRFAPTGRIVSPSGVPGAGSRERSQ
jgi:hypothetical protein